MELRALIGEHLLSQYEARYQDLHRATARERYALLMRRCPGIVDLLDLQDIASFLRSTSGRFALQRTSIPTPSARFAATSLFKSKKKLYSGQR